MTLTLMFLLTKKMRYTMEQAVRMKIREDTEIMVMVSSVTVYKQCLDLCIIVSLLYTAR